MNPLLCALGEGGQVSEQQEVPVLADLPVGLGCCWTRLQVLGKAYNDNDNNNGFGKICI